MALPLPPTLVELRQSVGIRVGLATSGKLSKSMQAVIDEHLNKCQREIFLRCAWARQLIDTTITAQQSVRDYDIPDEVGSVGGIQRLDIEDINGVRWGLTYDDDLSLENNTLYVDTPARPRTWQIIDDVIRVTPTVDAATWPTFHVRIIKGDQPLKEDGDRASVDGEALVQYATFITKEYLGVGGSQATARAEYQQYLMDLRSASVSAGRSFNIASELPTGVPYWRQPSADWAVAPYSASWNPVGNW